MEENSPPDKPLLNIRDATPDDAEACFIVHRAAALEGFAHIFPRDLYPFPEEEMRERWQRLCQVGNVRNVLVADRGGTVIGMAAYDATDFLSFFVLLSTAGPELLTICTKPCLVE